MIHAGYRHISLKTPSETRLSCRIARSARRVNGEAARINFLHNALGQRVFKGEPQAEQTLPSEAQLGTDFITWLKRQFGWLFAQAQANTSIGTAYTFADGPIPQWAILGEYDNGSAKGAGRSEYIWLPTQDGAIPVGMFRNGKFFAIHSDHLGTPRLMTTEANQPVWQWPYSAFGDNKPTGILRATPNPKAAITNIPVLLKATAATELNLRFPGQYDDAETGTVYNYQRQYLASQGRYTQPDPIGLEGGLNRFGYVEGNPLSYVDPMGLLKPTGWPWLDRMLTPFDTSRCATAECAAGFRETAPQARVESTDGLTCTVRAGLGVGVTATYNTQRGFTYIGAGPQAGLSISITGGGTTLMTGAGALGPVAQASGAFGNGVVGVSGNLTLGASGSTSTASPGVGTIGLSVGVTAGYRR